MVLGSGLVRPERTVGHALDIELVVTAENEFSPHHGPAGNRDR